MDRKAVPNGWKMKIDENLHEKIKDIYYNEFAFSFFENKSSKRDILLIFKLKKHKDINKIINIVFEDKLKM